MSIEDAKARIAEVANGQELLVCTRVWEAWSYNTMSADDFQTVADDGDMIEELATAAFTLTDDQWGAQHQKVWDAIYREMNGKYGDFGAGLSDACDAAMRALGFRRAGEDT
ncbi:hypothetical protein [Nesterenkonia sandarakina]|uniref:Uncharacterized protein n=1 Tax=Nesterenkonia sandarakina TaxID=272918 RepID=A0A2T0YJ82_9MICC|nr:hypothetical protein [Nesterenkonia sandarakina]PRZ15173.1 hypothetical protein BCL67_10994 [Nesterenkonia sandarakina]